MTSEVTVRILYFLALW